MDRYIFRNFVLGYFCGCFIFFLMSEQSLNFPKMEKPDLRLLKNEIVVLNLSANKNIFANTYESSIYDVEEVASKKENSIPIPINIKTKTREGKNSIFVEGFQAIRTFPARPKLNYYDKVENRMVKPSVMLQAHLKCIKQVAKLPRKILKIDRKVKFDKNYSGLFKENYEVFGYNLYLEENLSKDSSKNKIKQGKQKLFKKYGKESKQYLRKNLFENPCIIKSEKCKYLDTDNFVTIYYDELTDLFAIVDSKENRLLDFGIATEVKYGESFLTVENGEFKIQEWQAAKKIEHAVCFGIKPEDFGFSQDQAKQINAKGGIVVYVRKGNKLPSLDLIRAYQNAVKNFCEDRNQSDRNDKNTFGGEPSITFFNEKTRQIAVFNRETKIFITAYKLAERSVDEYLTTGNIGNN